MRPTCYYRHWCHSCSFCDLILESCGPTRRVCREGVAPHSEVVVIGWDLGPWMYIMYISVFLKKHTSCKLYIDETLKKTIAFKRKTNTGAFVIHYLISKFLTQILSFLETYTAVVCWHVENTWSWRVQL